jgi:Putative MetA-pathway of phenol degradation
MSQTDSRPFWGRFRSVALRTVAFAMAAVTPALSADWSLKFNSSESLSLDDNIGLDEIARDTALTSSTGFNFDLIAKGKTYQLEFLPALNVRKDFFRQVPSNWGYFPSANLLFTKSSKLTSLNLSARVAREAVSTNELIDEVLTSNNGDKLTYAFSGSVSRKLTARDSLIWSNSVSMIDYTLASPSLVPSRDIASSITYRRLISHLVTGDLTASADYYDPDSQLSESRMLYRTTGGLSANLTKRLSVSGQAGAVYLDPVGQGLSADLIFNMSADYKLKDTTYSLSAQRDLAPSQNGDLLDRYSTRFNIAHQVNDLMSLGLSGTYSFQYDEDNNKSSALTISPSIKYQLAKEWSSTLSYRFIKSDTQLTSANSNAVIFSLSYGTTLLP